MEISKIIWDELKKAGYSDFAIGGLIGNLYAESGLLPNNLQNTFNTKLGMTDEQYTAAVDNGTYKNFVMDKAGYGLAQWTYHTRKQNLLDYARACGKSIGDTVMQVQFLIKELMGYTKVISVLKSCTSVREASDIVLNEFEKPAKLATPKLEEERAEKRASYGMIYYNMYATGKTGGSNVPVNSTHVGTKKFNPRTTAPSASDSFWMHTSKGGKNECIHIEGGSCIPNCVGYAWGRFYEITGKRPTLSRANAEMWFGYTADGYKRSQTPAVGAVICWSKGKVGVSSDGAGHVAIVEEIKPNGDIVTSNSGYKSTRFYMKTITRASGYTLPGYGFQGFILPPDAEPIVNVVDNQSASGKSSGSGAPYTVKVTASALNIRSGPGTDNKIVGSINNGGVYTIVEEKNGWGRLRSGAGWISLNYVKRM